MEKVYLLILMVLGMMDNGLMINHLIKEKLSMQIKINIKANF